MRRSVRKNGAPRRWVHTDEIIVTASRTEQEVKETPSAVEVITRADIDKMGAETLAQALKLAIGIDIQENAMVGNRSAIRGMNTNQTLILVDGRRVRTENTSETMNYYELQRINMDDVERIEIVRAPQAPSMARRHSAASSTSSASTPIKRRQH